MRENRIGLAIDMVNRNSDNIAMTYDQLVAHYGSQVKAAQALGLAQSSVAEWKNTGIPDLRQLQYEIDSRGKLKADPAAKRPKAAA